MKFIWRYLFKKMRDIGNEPELYDRSMSSAKVSMSPESDWGDGLNIQVHSAHGGRIVTFRKYDRKSDRSNNQVYLIPDDRDFERELGKLITLEAMRG
jgi:hypothetical protein